VNQPVTRATERLLIVVGRAAYSVARRMLKSVRTASVTVCLSVCPSHSWCMHANGL